MKKEKLLVAFLLVSILFIGCQKEYFKSEPLSSGPVSFKTDILPIFSETCYGNGCHGGAQAPDLTAANAYTNLIDGGYDETDTLKPAENSILYVRITATSKFMPPTSKLSKERINKILQWIKQGAQDN